MALNNFFSKVDIKGSYYDRAKLVSDFMNYQCDAKKNNFVIARNPESTEMSYSLYSIVERDEEGNNLNWETAYFTNNRTHFMIGNLLSLAKIKDFKRNAILAIDSAETRGGTIIEKIIRFLDIFQNSANLIIIKGKESDYSYNLYYKYGNYLEEIRGDTKYILWVY